jgi:hypothetical protein
MRNWECGLRPLRAVGSIYEPEAVGAAWACAPEGKGERRKLGRWEDEKVSRAQSAWGIGLKADVGRRRKKKART